MRSPLRGRRKVEATNFEMANLGLPLSLQDLSLLEVINDLDSYPVELLSSLPYWMRYRLISNLPVLDLCRLDHTPVASGVDTEEIWKSLAEPTIFYNEKNPRIRPFVTRDILHKERALERWHYGHKPFVLERHFIERVNEFITKPVNIPDLDPGLVVAFSAIPDCVFSEGVVLKCGYVTPPVIGARELCLLKAVFHLLDRLKWMDTSSELYVSEYKVIYEWLVSLNYSESVAGIDKSTISKRGGEVKECTKNENLSKNHRAEDPEDNLTHQCLLAQTTALAKYRGVYDDVRLAPHRLLKIYEREDPLELFSLLIKHYGTPPLQIVLNHALLADSINSVFPDEDRREKFMHLVKEFLQNIQILGLRNKQTAIVSHDMCREIIESVIGNGKDCCLQVLFWNDTKTSINIGALSPSLCTLPCDHGPPRYQNLSALELICPISLEESLSYLSALLRQQILLKVAKFNLSFEDSSSSVVHELFNTLGSLFSRPHFQALTIEHDDSIKSSKYSLLILKGFLMSPCPHEQQLNYDIQDKFSLDSVEPPKKMNTNQITFVDLDLAGAETIPQCALNHKTFLTDTVDIFEQLLCFPHLRLKQLNLQLDVEFHCAALHPDLQVTTLRVDLGRNLPDTACDDMRALLKMPALMTLIITGELTSTSVPPLMQGLAEQARVGSLRFLVFDDDGSCNRSEFVKLFDVIFSLPQLSDLEVTFSGDKLLQNVEDYQEHIYEGWKCTASGRQLKRIQYIGFCSESNERDFTLLSKIALSSNCSLSYF